MSSKLEVKFNVEYPNSTVNNVNISQADHNEQERSHPNTQDVESQGDQKTIVVVLIGWTGAKDKQLAKYSDIYLKRGYIVVRCIIPVMAILVNQRKLNLLGVQLVNQLQEHKFHAYPIYFHVFSNGGAYVYSYVLKEIARQPNPAEFDIRGTIFDSAPVCLTFSTAHAAVKKIFSSFMRFNFGLAILATILFCVIGLVIKIYVLSKNAWVTSVRSTMRRPKETAVENYPLCDYQTRIWKLRNHPFMFLYSENDDVSPAKEVEEVAAAIRDRGGTARLVKFEGSDHVLHYRMYPTEYVFAITTFIDETMESNIGPAIYWDE